MSLKLYANLKLFIFSCVTVKYLSVMVRIRHQPNIAHEANDEVLRRRRVDERIVQLKISERRKKLAKSAASLRKLMSSIVSHHDRSDRRLAYYEKQLARDHVSLNDHWDTMVNEDYLSHSEFLALEKSYVAVRELFRVRFAHYHHSFVKYFHKMRSSGKNGTAACRLHHSFFDYYEECAQVVSRMSDVFFNK